MLISQPNFPPGLYSCPAGFVDPGESIETTVRREIAEELGIQISKPELISSAHWPFSGSGTGSVMMGFSAQVESEDFDPDEKEISDMRWFGPEELESGLKGKIPGLILPRRGAVAFQIIQHWLSQINKAKL